MKDWQNSNTFRTHEECLSQTSYGTYENNSPYCGSSVQQAMVEARRHGPNHQYKHSSLRCQMHSVKIVHIIISHMLGCPDTGMDTAMFKRKK